ncbi:hypothetical protein BDK61_3820 [Haloarcula quadrata]|uniref:DUF1643 domain-containing protein n=1 Tax=Haloarcula quadrata TaxID=182779 RepID=A0A495QVS5_9EURY|nr:DUF1643 domain-containing protein [Haloarcula quadrata]RKS78167.1 hypothetical protein BDK61_3820 [Haloarcula quadrata]
MNKKSLDRSERPTVSKDNRRGAEFDKSREYRHRLWHVWDVRKPTVAFIMLNPSTANENENDPTLRRCIGFAKDWGYGSIEVVNLFDLCATNPDDLRDHPNPVSDQNDEYLQKVSETAELVVAAWGANGTLYNRGLEVAKKLDVDLYALDTTKDGHPSHPLYQPTDTELESWNAGMLRDKADN